MFLTPPLKPKRKTKGAMTGTQRLRFSLATGLRMKYIIEIWDNDIITDYFYFCFHICKMKYVDIIIVFSFFTE